MKTANPGPFTPSDMPITSEGRVYHLDLAPEELAKDIIIVGDPERVSVMAKEFLASVECERFHRGLRTITGEVRGTGHRVTLTTSGMGTPSLEIVLNEIVILNEINLKTRKRKSSFDTINIIRVGTSGALQKNTELGTAIISEYAVGLDNTGLFYGTQSKETQALVAAVSKALGSKITPYASAADKALVQALENSAMHTGVLHKRGITISCSGFFANQGRDVSRISPTIQDIDGTLATLNSGMGSLQFENMEMETSFLLHFMGALGYRAGAICPVIANRRMDTFATDYQQNVRDATRAALDALRHSRKIE